MRYLNWLNRRSVGGIATPNRGVRNDEGKNSAMRIGVLSPNPPSVCFDYFMTNGEAKPCSTGAGFRLAALHKFFKYSREFAIGDARSLVNDPALNGRLAVVAWAFPKPRQQLRRPLWRT